MSGGIGAEPPVQQPPDERSRRQLLSAGGALGAAALVAGCTSKVPQPSNIHFSPKTPGAAQDVAILNGLLSLEYRSIAAYTACIPLLPQPTPPAKTPHSGGLFAPPPSMARRPNAPPPPLKLLVPLAYAASQQFLTQELAHVSELSSLIKNGGGRAVKPDASYDLGHPRTKQQVLLLLHRTEERLLEGYLRALTSLTLAGLRGAAAAIFANHAQHTTVLRLELGLAPIPSAFVSRPE